MKLITFSYEGISRIGAIQQEGRLLTCMLPINLCLNLRGKSVPVKLRKHLFPRI